MESFKLHSSRLTKTAVLILFMLAAFFLPIANATEQEPIFTVKPPPGFDEISEEERTIVDIVFEGKKIGTTVAHYVNENIIFEDPAGLASLIPELRDHEIVATALQESLSQNRGLHCDKITTNKLQIEKIDCGYLQPDIVGVIFYPQKLEAHMFISERFTYSRDSRARYLPPPTTSPGLIIGSNSRGIYNNNTDNITGNTSLNMIAGNGRLSLSTDIYADWDDSQQLQSAAFTYTGKKTEFTGGYLPYSNGSSLVRSSRLMGLRYSTTLKTRLDKDNLSASEIPISISSSAVIEILRNNQVLDIQRAEPGQTTLDTRRFPGGSYEITLRITENETTRDETRFYSKGSALPPSGNAQWFAEVGYPTQNTSQGRFSPRLNDEIQMSAGMSKRLTSSVGLSAVISGSELDQYAEVSTFLQGPRFSAQLGLLGSTDDDYGYFSRFSYRQGQWYFSANYREIIADQEMGIDINAPYDPFPQSFRQGGLNTSYRFKHGKIGARGFYRQSSDNEKSYFGGPYLDWNIFKSRKSRLDFFAQAETGSDRDSYYAGFRFYTLGRSLNFNSDASTRIDEPNISGIHTTRNIFETSVRYVNSQPSSYNMVYNAGARFEQLENDDEFGLRAGFTSKNPVGEFGLDARHNYQNQDNVLGTLITGLAFGGGHMAITPNYHQESGAIVAIDGNQVADFDLIINGSKRKHMMSGKDAFLPLTSYEIHDIGIRPRHSSDLEYEHHTDRVVTYPGNVIIVKRNAISVYIVIGQIIDQENKPLANVAIFGDDFLGFSDEAGYFQIDLSDQTQLLIKQKDIGECKVNLNQKPVSKAFDSDFVNLGKLICVSL